MAVRAARALLLLLLPPLLILAPLLPPPTRAASRPLKQRHAGISRREPPLDVPIRIAQDIAVKIVNVSSITQLYNLMVRYNKDYCDGLKELENMSKSEEDKTTLLNMKSFCKHLTQKYMIRSLQRRAVRGSKKIGNQAHQIESLMKQSQHSKTGCKPKPTLYEYPPSAESVYLPRCTNVKRCSGCCANKLHFCRPVADDIHFVKRKVVDIRVSTKDYKPIMKIKKMEVEQHGKCECVCKVNIQCSLLQDFDEQNCSCKCRNSQEMVCSFPRAWNSDNCKCECLPSTSCSFGHHRDSETCKCIKNPSINNLTIKLKKRGRNVNVPK